MWRLQLEEEWLAWAEPLEALLLAGKPEVDLFEVRASAQVGVPAVIGVADEAPDHPSLSSLGGAGVADQPET